MSAEPAVPRIVATDEPEDLRLLMLAIHEFERATGVLIDAVRMEASQAQVLLVQPRRIVGARCHENAGHALELCLHPHPVPGQAQDRTIGVKVDVKREAGR